VTLRVGFLERPLPFHLLLAPMALPLVLTSANIYIIPLTAALRSIIVGWAVVLTLWAALTRITGNARTSALFVTLMIFGFFADSAVDTVAGPARPAAALLTWCVLLALGLTILRFGREVRGLTVVANLFFLILCASPCLGIARFELARPAAVVRRPHLEALSVNATQSLAALPDVYLFVLDGYGRADVLRELYGYDDTLVRRLRAAGFYVADLGSSNYAQTALSLASSLNLDYVPALTDQIASDSASRRPLMSLIRENLTFRTFSRAGYRIVTFASEYGMVRFDGADQECRPWLYLTDFEYSLYDASALPRLSMLAGLSRAWLPHQIRRHYVWWTLDRLSKPVTASDGRPTLVFVHLMLPHPPFTFRADGTYTWTNLPAGLFDGDHWRTVQRQSDEGYEAGYLGNIRFLDGQFAPIIETILARASRPTAILIQGDHGPGARLAWNDPSASNMKERLGILLAMRLPDGDSAALYPTITPVNATRVLLNRVLGTSLPLLDDRSWFSTWPRPYLFHDVTAQVR